MILHHRETEKNQKTDVELPAVSGQKAMAESDPPGSEEVNETSADLCAGKKTGHVTLVGAGPGSDLITVRGLRALSRADAVLYDDLIDRSLLASVPSGCSCIPVGKRSGRPSWREEEIEALLIRLSGEGREVVRLKGGDSFVFGRGGEEVLALQEAGIPCDVIPGVTSAVSVPEELGIPVTHRQVARSFTVVTGHTADGTTEDYHALAALKGTLVFLMGLAAAPAISAELIRNGKRPDTPAAVLSRGFSPDEARFDCTLETLPEAAGKAASPAIIIVGDVAALHLESRQERPLSGTSVAITGTNHFIQTLSASLAPLGAEVLPVPCLSILPMPEAIPADISGYSWFVFTSANGVQIFFGELLRRGFDLRRFARQRFACIGTGTADALRKYGVTSDFIPSVYTGEALGRELGERICQEACDKSDLLPTSPEHPVLLLRAANGSESLPAALKAAAVPFSDLRIYRTGDTSADAPISTGADYIVFGSGAGVRAFFRHHALPPAAVPVCIGPSTAEAFRAVSPRDYIMPSVHSVQGITNEILHRRNQIHP